jgi:DNA-binding transcriptional LysR family regulator
MVHMYNRSQRFAPIIQQSCDARFRRGIVASTPRRIIEAFLHINHDQRCIWIEWLHLFSAFDLDSITDCACSGADVQRNDGGIGFADQLKMTNDLEIRHCRVLLAVSDHGSVSAAARALGLAQSTVSETLLSLERLIGIPVTLRRPGQEAELTVAAVALLPHAHALIGASEAALAAVTSDYRNAIRLGAVESASTFLLPRALTAFRSHWPALDVQIAIGLCDDLRKRVHRRELDAAITVEGPEGALDREGSGSRMLSPTRLCLFVASRETLGGLKVMRRDLARRPMLLPDPDGAFNAMMRAWFATQDEQPRFESAGSIDGVKIGVRSGKYVGLLPAYAVAKELALGEFLEVRVQEALPTIALGLTTYYRPAEASPLEDMIQCIEQASAAIH